MARALACLLACLLVRSSPGPGREELERNDLGSPPGAELLFRLKPRYWFAAHLHAKFAAVVEHNRDHDHEQQQQQQSPLPPPTTRFLALDKCLPNRDFLQCVDVVPNDDDASADSSLQYDPSWLAIIRETHRYYPTHHYPSGLRQGRQLDKIRQLRQSSQVRGGGLCVSEWWYCVCQSGGIVCVKVVVLCVSEWWYCVHQSGGIVCIRVVVLCASKWWYCVYQSSAIVPE